ncbi:MAG: helix-turn-helix domain-containing protein [Treponema sp.]|jgi:two-component system response regulator YesN|nr:helix-turn-helix domain-containing protein [Treponema sp.]
MSHTSPLDICIADDESAIQKSIIARLRICGVPVRILGCADNAEKAIALYWASKPDVFFIDINMPGMDGLNLIRKIKQEDRLCRTKFVIITGYDDYAHLREAIQSGVFDYLKKPIYTEEFNKVLVMISEEVSKEKENINNNRKNHGMVSYEEYTAGASKPLSGGILAGIYAPSYSILSQNNEHIRSIFMEKTGGDCIALNFQIVKNFLLYLSLSHSDGLPAIKSISHDFITLIQETGLSVVYTLPYSESLADLIERMEQTINKRFIRRGFYECISSPLKDSVDLGLLDYALENGEDATCRKIINDYLYRTAGNLTSISGLSLLYREIILLIINKHVFYHIPIPDHLNAELSPFALCRYPSLEYLRVQLCGMTTELTQKTAEGKNGQGIITSICDYLKKNYKQNITLNTLADKFYVSPSYLSRRFKEKTGITFVQYLEDIRMEKAREYLSRSNAQITDISEQVGYMDLSYFSKVFKKKYLVSPSYYRLHDHL